jgi:ankyrin repeat protein
MSDTRPSRARRLPEHPNLEQLKKQAKELLQNFRSGAPDAVAEVRQFEREPIADFALSDAQRVLARAYGFPSWPKLKAFVDGANIARFVEAAKNGEMAQVRSMLANRPELVSMDTSESNEHRAIHYAVLARNAAMVRLLMEAGADARKGIYPHRDATSALAIARERDYTDIVEVIEEEERLRREEMSCSNATVSPVQDQISSAIARGETAAAIALLQTDLSLIQACDRDGFTPLHVAARRNNLELIEWLLHRRASVRKQDPNGLTPLDHAALSADPRNDHAVKFPAAAELLRRHGAELTIRAAVALGDGSRVRDLLAADPSSLRQINPSGGLLSLAAKHRQFEMARLLLDLGADVDERINLPELEVPTETWGMPLWYSALAGDFAISKLLLDRGADPNANVYASGWPLRNALNHPDPSVKNLLLERGAKAQPYTVAEFHDVAEAKKLLAENPAEEVTSELAWSAAHHGCPEILELALTHLQWPLSSDRWHWVLIQPPRGASGVSSENEGHLRCMQLLLQHGIDPNISRYGQTTLHFIAAYRGDLPDIDRPRFAALLLDHGANLHLRDDLLKSTPLGWACRWGRQPLVELLLQRGSSPNEPDAEPWATPAAWAQRMHHHAILQLVRKP